MNTGRRTEIDHMVRLFDSLSVMFNDQETYIGYQREHARSMENTAGFYSPTANRLVLFLQPGVDIDQTLAIARHARTWSGRRGRAGSA